MNDITANIASQAMSQMQSGQVINTAAKFGNVTSGNTKMDKAAQDFEAVYISQMLGHMFEGIETDGLFGGGNAEEIYRTMLVDEYGKLISQSGGIGLSDALSKEMLALQQQANGGR